MNDTSRWLTTYDAMQFARELGKMVSTESIRRACEAGAIPLAERHAISSDRELWLIPRRTLRIWVAEGMPSHHRNQAELIRSGERLIPGRLSGTRE